MAQYKGRQYNTSRGSTAYIQGNTVRKLDESLYAPRQPKKQISHTARKNREKADHMSFGYVLFLACALVAAGIILTGYIGLQSDITNSINSISSLESRLNNLKLDNDEEYSRITSNIDLEEVKRVAIQELGMRYAKEGQIITFSDEGSNYVRQIADIPQ